MNEPTILIQGHEVPEAKIAEAEEMVLAWTDEQEADRDEPCICFFRETSTRFPHWSVVEGGDAGALSRTVVCIGLADALKAWDMIRHKDGSYRVIVTVENSFEVIAKTMADAERQVREFDLLPTLRGDDEAKFTHCYLSVTGVKVQGPRKTVGYDDPDPDDFGREQQLDAWADSRETSNPFD